MPELSPPTVLVAASFRLAMAEFQAEGRGVPADSSMLGQEIRAFGGSWQTLRGFTAYVDALRAQAREDTPRPAGIVASTTLWWIDGRDYLGRITVRHRLTPTLEVVGGHIGYDVRPTARRRGHATAMLRAALPVARHLGIDRALVTCLESNVASRRVIERNGGILDSEGDGMLRFRVPTDRPL